MANRPAFYIKTPSILYQNARRFMAKRTAFPYKTQNASLRFGPKRKMIRPKTETN